MFADEPGAAPDLEAARALVAGRSLADVADDEEVVGLVDGWDLLWYAPAELDASGSCDARPATGSDEFARPPGQTPAGRCTIVLTTRGCG